MISSESLKNTNLSYRANDTGEITVQTELNFDNTAESESQSSTPLNWLNRSYESMKEWKAKALKVFLSVNGDSNVARNRVASQVRKYFEKTSLVPEDVQRWKKGINEIETIRVIPPKSSESRSGYVDWLHIADLLLMSGCADGEAINEEQQERDTEFLNVQRSYKMRVVVEEARAELRRDPTLSDDSLSEHLKEKFSEMFKDKDKDPPAVAIKEARKLEKSGVRTPSPKAPIKSEPIPRYTTLYFQG
jgi:hypothetical protein